MSEQPRRVLIVQADRVEAGILAFQMRQAGYQALHVTSTDEAQDAIAWGHPDAFVIELEGDGIDGLSFVRQLEGAPARVVLITDRPLGPDEDLELLRLGVRDVFAKPVDPTVIEQRVAAGPGDGIGGRERPDGTIVGTLSERSMLDLLRMLVRHRLDATVAVDGPTSGEIIVRAGQVIDGATGEGATGRQAAVALVAANRGSFELRLLPATAPELARRDVVAADLAALVASATGGDSDRGERARRPAKAMSEPPGAPAETAAAPPEPTPASGRPRRPTGMRLQIGIPMIGEEAPAPLPSTPEADRTETVVPPDAPSPDPEAQWGPPVPADRSEAEPRKRSGSRRKVITKPRVRQPDETVEQPAAAPAEATEEEGDVGSTAEYPMSAMKRVARSARQTGRQALRIPSRPSGALRTGERLPLERGGPPPRREPAEPDPWRDRPQEAATLARDDEDDDDFLLEPSPPTPQPVRSATPVGRPRPLPGPPRERLVPPPMRRLGPLPPAYRSDRGEGQAARAEAESFESTSARRHQPVAQFERTGADREARRTPEEHVRSGGTDPMSGHYDRRPAAPTPPEPFLEEPGRVVENDRQDAGEVGEPARPEAFEARGRPAPGPGVPDADPEPRRHAPEPHRRPVGDEEERRAPQPRRRETFEEYAQRRADFERQERRAQEPQPRDEFERQARREPSDERDGRRSEAAAEDDWFDAPPRARQDTGRRAEPREPDVPSPSGKARVQGLSIAEVSARLAERERELERLEHGVEERSQLARTDDSRLARTDDSRLTRTDDSRLARTDDSRLARTDDSRLDDATRPGDVGADESDERVPARLMPRSFFQDGQRPVRRLRRTGDSSDEGEPEEETSTRTDLTALPEDAFERGPAPHRDRATSPNATAVRPRTQRSPYRTAAAVLALLLVLSAGFVIIRLIVRDPATPPDEKAAQIEPYEAKLGQAVLDAEAGRIQEAIDELRALLAEKPEDPAALASLGALLFRDGDAEGAEPILARLVEVKGDEASTYWYLGHVKLALDKREEARTAWTRYLELAPESDPQRATIAELVEKL